MSDELINAYQNLVRKDIQYILEGKGLDEETITLQENEYPSISRLISKDSCGRKHTIHGLLIETLINMKFLPFQEYFPMVEYKVLGEGAQPGIKEPILKYNVLIEKLIEDIDQVNCKDNRVKEAAKVVLRALKRDPSIKAISEFQRDYIIEYIKNKCLGSKKDIIIDAPTGSGKTLIFMFMALCESLLGNRALIIYPRKQLAEDQANNFIRYVYYVRSELENYMKSTQLVIPNFKMPTLIVIDGDHTNDPSQINERTFLSDERIAKKALKCPIDHSNLLFDPHLGIVCEKGHRLDFLYVFKRDLNNMPSIVITNRYVVLTRLLHRKVNLNVLLDRVNIIILDEAHVYTNLEGGDTALFIRLLNDYVNAFNNYEPAWVISSATIPSPLNFAEDLIGRSNFVRYDYSFYQTNTHKLIIPLLLLPTPQFSAETVAQFTALITLLWSYKFNNKSLMFIDSRSEISRLMHYIKEIILERGGFDPYRVAGDIILYHSRVGINHFIKQSGERFSRFNVDCNALWDHLIDPQHLNDWQNFLDKLKDSVDFHYAWHSGVTRTKLFNRFMKGEVKMLLATSTLELGINVPDVSVIIQYKLPIRSESYTQRIGRAGRNPESYRIVTGILILSQAPTSVAYLYDEDLQQKLININKMPKPPVNLSNKRLQLRHEFHRLLISYKRRGGDTHYPKW
jgi:hypothetical protein